MVQADMSAWNWLLSIVFKRTTKLQVLSMVETSLKRVKEREKETNRKKEAINNTGQNKLMLENKPFNRAMRFLGMSGN